MVFPLEKLLQLFKKVIVSGWDENKALGTNLNN